jgi:hypothetical protein
MARTAADVTRDPLTAAIEASMRWYDRIFAFHGVPVRSDDRLWTALADPPPWHSAVKTLVRDVDADAVLAAMERHPYGSVADSYGALDLGKHGFDLLIDSTWVHHGGIAEATWPPDWSVVGDASQLGRWCRRHDYVGVLPAAVLTDPEFDILVRVADGEPVAGAIVHNAGQVAGMSNLWSSSDPLTPADVADLLACAGVLHPGRPVTDYACGEELDVLLGAGFTPLGAQRVWAR